jgi:HEAT repeat protein
MSMLITWTLGALAWVPAQDEGRAAAVRAQLEKEVQGKAPAAPAAVRGVAQEEDPILALLKQLEQDSHTSSARLKLRQLGSAVRPILPRYLGQLSPIALRGTLQFLLEEAPDAEAVAALERLLGGADPVARVVVARSLDDVRGPARAGLIDRALASVDPRVRHEALRALGRSEQMDPRLATAVGELARSENSEERRLAAELCGSDALRGRSEVGAIVEDLAGDPELEVRRVASEAWLARSAKATEVEAVAFYQRLEGDAHRADFLRSAFQREMPERPWPKLYDRGIEHVQRWPENELQAIVQRFLHELAPETLLVVASKAERMLDPVIRELARRGSSAGVEMAVARLANDSSNQGLFEYLRKIAPDRLIPLGKRLVVAHWSWEFYEAHADADTVRAALDVMRSYRQGHDSRELQRIVRDRSDASCFESLLEAVPPREPNERDAPWTGAVRAALVRLAGPEQLAIVLDRCTEIDAETLLKLLEALRPHWKPEHAPMLVAASERYIAKTGFSHRGFCDALAMGVGTAGRAALQRQVEAANENAAFAAWLALSQSASAEEQHALLLRALAPNASSELVEHALETYSAVIAADAELRTLATPWFARGQATEVLIRDWPRLVPPDVRSAEVRKLVAALRSSKRDDVREAAVMMLGYLRGPEVVAEIAPFLEDPATKNNAILALQQTGERDAVPLIIECLRDPSEQTRVAAKEALEALELYFEAKSRWEKR